MATIKEHPITTFMARLASRIGVKALRAAKESLEDDGAEIVDELATEVKTRVQKHRTTKKKKGDPQ